MLSKWEIYNDKVKTVLQENPQLLENKLWKETVDKVIILEDKNDRKAFSTHIKRHHKRILDLHEGIYDATNGLDVANSDVKHLWIKDKGASLFVKNPNYVDPEVEPEKTIDFLSIFKDKIDPILIKKRSSFKSTSIFDRLVITDIHIGMDVNKDGYALYDGEWNEKILFERLEIVVNHTLQNKKSDSLIIHDLGDYLDGFDGLTTRGGHQLPQNMDNQQMFDVGLKFKINAISVVFHIAD